LDATKRCFRLIRMRAVATVLGLVLLALWGGPASGGPDDVGYFDPAWSPDGKQIAFVDRNGGHAGDLFVMDADGTNVRQRTHGSRDWAQDQYSAGGPDWSPDGRSIAFRFGYENFDTIAADGSGLRIITQGSGPSWSPRGRKIAFAQGSDTDGASIFVVNPNGSGRILVAAPRNIYHSYWGPTWSPDGEQMAFGISPAPDTGWGGVPRALGVISQYRGPVRLLRTAPYRATAPDWSPDGRRILFTDNGQHIVILELRHHRFRTIFKRSGTVFGPRWSPNGKRIAFSWRSDIWIMGADGSALRRLIG
jgi:TolB protein